MKRWVVPALGLWAVVATVAALVFASSKPEPVESVERVVEVVSRRSTHGERSRERLRRRVDELEAALAATFVESAEDADAPAAPGAPAEPERSPGERLLALLDEERRLEESDDWTTGTSQALRGRMHALLAGDASTHSALMSRLREAPDEDAAWDLLGLLVENPFVRMRSNGRVTEEIRSSAREMLADPLPHRRAAAVRVLFGYRGTTREDALLAIERLAVEPDDAVREDVLADASGGARDLGLSEEEARPLLEQLRETIGTPGGTWAAGALAEWSVEAADYERITRLLATERDPSAAQDLLNALDRDKRLVGPRVDDARDVLLGVLADPTRNESVRDLAHHFLLGYAPWDDATASAVRRYLASIR